MEMAKNLWSHYFYQDKTTHLCVPVKECRKMPKNSHMIFIKAGEEYPDLQGDTQVHGVTDNVSHKRTMR